MRRTGYSWLSWLDAFGPLVLGSDGAGTEGRAGISREIASCSDAVSEKSPSGQSNAAVVPEMPSLLNRF